MVRSLSNKRGATFIEVMVASGLLLVISGVFFSLIVPAMQREDWFGRHQSGERGYLIAKKRLNTLLRHRQIIEDPPFDDGTDRVLLVYVQPVQTDTEFGTLSEIDFNEVVNFDAANLYQIRLTGDGQLQNRAPDDSRALIWNLGDSVTSSDVIKSTDLRRLDFTFQGTQSEKFSTNQNWEYQITVFVD